MEHSSIVVPILIGFSFWVVSCLYFLVRMLIGRPVGPTHLDRRTHSLFFAFFMRYFLWLINPVERGLQRCSVTPNTITMTSIFVSAGSGIAVASGHLAVAGWLLIASGGLDVLDGRLARAMNRESSSGAFLDSVADRWSELLVLTGFAYYFRETYWLLAVLVATGTSMMVSYTRARGEAIGVKLDGGHMQRPERLTIISIGALLAGWFHASGNHDLATLTAGGALAIVGVGAGITALGRFRAGYKLLREQDLKSAHAD